MKSSISVVKDLETAAGGVGENELEAAGLTDAGNRRRRHEQHIRFLERPEQFVQPVISACTELPWPDRFDQGFKGMKPEPVYGVLTWARRFRPVMASMLSTSGCCWTTARICSSTCLGPLQRCTGRQLRHHQQVPLVILGQKPAGPQPNQESERHDDYAEHAERNGGTADGMAHGVGVLLRGARKGAIECSEAASKKPGGLGLRARFQQASRTKPA